MVGRRCAFEGCRAWARADSAWCVAHPEGKRRRVGGGRAGNQNARTHGLYAEYVPVVEVKRALELPPGDLRLEIAVTRAILGDLLGSGLPPAELLNVLEIGSATLTRLLRTNKALGGAADEDADDGLRRALRELRRVESGRGTRSTRRHGDTERGTR